MTGPLDGIRIIEIANVVAGPSAAAQLADQGADVIKIEPPSGDIIRKSSKTGLPPTFISCNRGKRSLTLDLKQACRPRNIMEVNRESRCVNSKPSARRNGKTWL